MELQQQAQLRILKKITPELAVQLSQQINRPSYFSSPYWLTENCVYEEHNGEILVYVNDRTVGKTIHLFTPQNSTNITTKEIAIATTEEIEKLKTQGIKIKEIQPLGYEYFYDTNGLINLQGSDWAKIRKDVNKFKKTYNYKILHKYPAQKVINFILEWAADKDFSKYEKADKVNFFWDLDNCIDYVKNRKKFPTKRIYIEIDGQLAGFSFLHQHTNGTIIGLQQKVNSKYKGIARFLYHEKAKMFPNKIMTTGTSDDIPGLKQFKEELNPVKKQELFYLILD